MGDIAFPNSVCVSRLVPALVRTTFLCYTRRTFSVHLHTHTSELAGTWLPLEFSNYPGNNNNNKLDPIAPIISVLHGVSDIDAKLR